MTTEETDNMIQEWIFSVGLERALSAAKVNFVRMNKAGHLSTAGVRLGLLRFIERHTTPLPRRTNGA